MRTKRILLSFIAFALLSSLLFVSGSALQSPQNAQKTIDDRASVTCLSIPACEVRYGSASERQNCLIYSYLESEGETDPSIISKEYTVPQDFCVLSDGSVWVLDTGGGCIKRFDPVTGAEINRIEAEGVKYAQMLAVDGDVFYVLDTVMNSVIRIQNGASVRLALPMGEESFFNPVMEEYITFEFELGTVIADMYCSGGCLYVNAAAYGTYVLHGDKFEKCSPAIEISDEGGFFRVKKGAQSWQFSSENISVEILGADEEGNLYVYRNSTLMYDGYFVGDNYVSVYDAESNMFFNRRIEYDREIGLPVKHMRLGADGRIYQMTCKEDAVEIIGYEVYEYCEDLCQDYILQIKRLRQLPTRDDGDIIATEVSNPEALFSAYEYATHLYYVDYSNQHDWDEDENNTDFVVPKCVADIGSDGGYVMGVAYSRGNWDSIEYFDQAISTPVPADDYLN